MLGSVLPRSWCVMRSFLMPNMRSMTAPCFGRPVARSIFEILSMANAISTSFELNSGPSSTTMFVGHASVTAHALVEEFKDRIAPRSAETKDECKRHARVRVDQHAEVRPFRAGAPVTLETSSKSRGVWSISPMAQTRSP